MQDPLSTRLGKESPPLIDGPGLVDHEGRIVFSYGDPIFRAPFSLIGDGGEDAPGSSCPESHVGFMPTGQEAPCRRK
jgi:hypothetical protein